MKKILSVLLAAAFILSQAAVLSFAEDADAGSLIAADSPNEPTSAELEKIIKLVKPKLDIPDECSAFTWNYNSPSYYSTSSWNLSWYNADRSLQYNVTCDAEGRISSYGKYDRNSTWSLKLPEKTKEELKDVAESALKSLVPEAAPSLRLTSSSSNGLYSKSYAYHFTRYENGIIVPDDTATVVVDNITGEVKSLYVSYNYTVKFDGGKALVSEDAAKDTLISEQTMKLSYRLKTEYDDDGKLKSRKAYLVYTPEIFYLSVDANTGKVYTERNTWSVRDAAPTADFAASYSENAKLMMDGAAADRDEAEYELTEEELGQLEVLESLITKDEAIKVITENEYLSINEANIVEAYLTKRSNSYVYKYSDDSEQEKYQWNIYFSAPYTSSTSENGYYSPYMSAAVDAEDGKIISFYSSVPGYRYYVNDVRTLDIPALAYSKEQSAEIFESFARGQIPEKMENARLSDNRDSVIICYKNAKDFEEPVYRSASLNYVMVNEGVDFTYNSVRGAVDRVTGKITSFNYNWYDDVVFESPSKAISPEDAYKSLLGSDGFGLNYEINSNYTYNQYLAEDTGKSIDFDKLYETEQYTRLVYSGYKYPTTTVSALTGELLNYNGDPYKESGEYAYSDIENHWAKDDILMLADLGIGFEGEKFNPDSSISAKDYMYLLNSLGKYPNEMSGDYDINASSLTRTEAVKLIIDAAGYYKIAAMPDIFITDFADNSDLERGDVGFIAIARGMKLVQGDLGLFRPYDKITRAEAVTLIVNTIRLSF